MDAPGSTRAAARDWAPPARATCWPDVIAGLAARGASAEQAAAWGVFLHARAGALLEKRLGKVGLLAREISADDPRADGIPAIALAGQDLHGPFHFASSTTRVFFRPPSGGDMRLSVSDL